MSDRSPYVPVYQHDIYVSYAQVDNLFSSEADRWVHTLVDNFTELLSGQLGRREWGDIWLDRRIEVGDEIPDEIRSALDNSAVLLVILSEGYLTSTWCTRERERFLSKLEQQGARGRVFIVHKMDIALERQPESFRDLNGLPFFQRNRDGSYASTLGFPLPNPKNPEDRPYYHRLDDLSRKVAQRLKALRDNTGTDHDDMPSAKAIESKQSTPVSTAAEPDALFIAETTPDLQAPDFQRYLQVLQGAAAP